jgi:hypothetical protein
MGILSSPFVPFYTLQENIRRTPALDFPQARLPSGNNWNADPGAFDEKTGTS